METRLVLGIIVVVTLGAGMTFLAASAELKPEQMRLQLATMASNTSNPIGNGSALSSLSSSSSSMNIRPNVQTDFNPNVTVPTISKFAYLDPLALIIGDCEIGKLVLVAPFAVCRADEGIPIHVGDYSNMQDGVILHALETASHGKNLDDRRYTSEGSLLKANDTGFENGFAIYVGDKVSLAHGVQVHGPAYVGNDTFVGMKSLIFNAKIGNRVAIGVSSTVTNGVTIDDDKLVPPGTIVTTQAQANALPARVGSPYEEINKAVIHVNQELANGYNAQEIQELATEMEAVLEDEGMLQTGSPTGNQELDPPVNNTTG
jgi:carbon dioxide concentrating mechanism protein CcmM